MESKIQKWGNSLAIRIPKSLAQSIQLTAGAGIRLTVQDGKLVVEPQSKGKYSLKELVKGITRDNLHGEVDWGEPKGKEIW